MFGDTNAQNSGGSINIGDKVQFSLRLTLDNSSDDSKLNGANIQILDLNSGDILNIEYNIGGTQFVIAAGNNFKISCKRLGMYFPPVDYSSFAGNGVNMDIVLNYITAPTGVYIYTMDERLVEPSLFDRTKDDYIGVYVGDSEHKLVFGDVISISYNAPKRSTYGTKQDDSPFETAYIDRTESILSSGFSNVDAVLICKNFIFPNGLNGSCPPAGYIFKLLNNYTDVSKAYSAIGKSIATVAGTLYFQSSSLMPSSSYEHTVICRFLESSNSVDGNSYTPNRSIPYFSLN